MELQGGGAPWEGCDMQMDQDEKIFTLEEYSPTPKQKENRAHQPFHDKSTTARQWQRAASWAFTSVRRRVSS